MDLTEKRKQLETINAAILAIETGAQEYRINSRMVRRGDLAILYRERRALETDIARLEQQQTGGGTYVAAYYR